MAATFSVDIIARFAQFQDTMNRVLKESKRTADTITSAFSTVKNVLASIGVGVSIGAVVAHFKALIDSADKLNDLQKSTAISAETLGALGFAAQQSGTDLEGVAKSVGKMNLEVAAATGGNEKAQEVFRNLGFTLNELKTNTPEQTLIKLATAFSSAADDANKAAYAQAIFKKRLAISIAIARRRRGKISKEY